METNEHDRKIEQALERTFLGMVNFLAKSTVMLNPEDPKAVEVATTGATSLLEMKIVWQKVQKMKDLDQG
jgi:hypothetical protein